MDEKQFNTLTEKLEEISGLLAISIVEGKKQGDQIRVLSKAGLGPKRIASLLGTTSNTVNVKLSGMRKRGQM